MSGALENVSSTNGLKAALPELAGMEVCVPRQTTQDSGGNAGSPILGGISFVGSGAAENFSSTNGLNAAPPELVGVEVQTGDSANLDSQQVSKPNEAKKQGNRSRRNAHDENVPSARGTTTATPRRSSRISRSGASVGTTPSTGGSIMATTRRIARSSSQKNIKN